MKDRRKILVVDDDPVVTRMLDRILTSDGYEVHMAFDGAEGLKVARQVMPDLILLDLVMPTPNGMDVARELTADENMCGIPIVFMTVRLKVKDDKGDLEMDVDGRKCRAFAKPLHNRKLLSAIRKIINTRANNN